jgi:tetratricopeptide (TPR) repeat protein
MSRRSKKQPLKKAAPAADANPRVAAPVMVQESHETEHLALSRHVAIQQAPQTWPGRDWIIAMLLFAALVLAYYPALRGGFLWDDDTYITANPALLTLAGLRAIWLDPSATCQYYPLSFTFFWTIYHLFGLNPFWFHLVTLLLHGTGAVLFWQVLERLRVRGALLAAAIFALHPVNVMSVAWMTELKNTLSCSLALGAAWAYVRFAALGVYERPPDAATKQTPWRWYILSLVLFQLAMLAKTAVSFLPASLLLVVWWQRPRITRRDLLSLIPMLGISVGMGAFTIYIERHAGGASGAEFTIGFLDRVLISGRSFWFYLGKLLWPDPLIFIYPRWKLDAGEWWQWLYPLATLAALSAAWIARRRIGKGVFAALMHFYISTSMLVLAVVLYMMRYSFVADHWQYFGSLSIIALIASGFTRAMDRLGETWGRPLEMAIGIILVLGLGALTWAQSGMYSDIETLWRTTIDRDPGSWLAHNNLADVLLDQWRTQEAIVQCREALRIDPTKEESYGNLGRALDQEGRTAEAVAQYRESLRINPAYVKAHNNLGDALFKLGRNQEAIAEYREAFRIVPGYADAHLNLGLVLFQEGRIDDAIAEYREALRINPVLAEAYCKLGDALLRQRKPEEAVAEYREAFQLDPTYAEAHNNLGTTLLWQGRTDEAVAEYREALRIKPAYPEAACNLGDALLRQGNAQEAIAEYREALRINPAFAQGYNSLGNALVQQGRAQEAIAEYREALRIKPDFADASCNLGNVLFQQGRADEAIAQYRETLRIDPALAVAHDNLGLVVFQQGRTDEAIAEYREALQIKPAYVQAQVNLGNALLQQGRMDEAIAAMEKAFELQPANVLIENNLAWLLATASQSSLRNGARAVQLAAQASQATGGGNPLVLRTLAAAYAQAGQFPNAIQTAQKALQLAQAQSNTALSVMLPREINLYHAGRTYEDVH